MKKFVCILAAVMFAVLAIVPAIAGAESSNTFYVDTENGKTLNLRANPSTGARVLARMGVGKPVTLIDFLDDTWAHISVMINGRNVKGYVMREFITRNDPSIEIQHFVKTRYQVSVAPSKGDAGHVNLRREPNTQSTIRAYLENDEVVTVIAESHSWYKVRTADGVEGYVVKGFVNKF